MKMMKMKQNLEAEISCCPKLGPHASAAGDPGLIPSQGTKIPKAMWHGQKKKNSGGDVLVGCRCLVDRRGPGAETQD